MECREARELFSEYLDKQLAHEENLKLISHLEVCPECREELDRMDSLLAAIHSRSMIELTAPEGFASSVMARIKQEEAARAKGRWKRWKQAGAAAAAALLLASGPILMNNTPLLQVADNPVISEPSPEVTSSLDSNNPAPDNTPTPVGETAVPPDSVTVAPKDTETDAKTNGTPAGTRSNPVLTNNQEFVIVSTLLKVETADVDNAEKRALSMAKACGASTQSLGQQYQDGKLYLVDKIVVDSSSAGQLISSLAALGAEAAPRQVQRENLTTRYNELYSQLINLEQQLAQTQDSAQISQLRTQIAGIEKMLDSISKQSSDQTIVLWLQQQ